MSTLRFIKRFTVSTSESLISDRLRKIRKLDEIQLFEDLDFWQAKTPASGRFERFLDPHSKHYFSMLRPVFLHQLRSVQVLDVLSPVLARDGLLTLLHFFQRNTKPTGENVCLLLPPRMAPVVPEAWQKQVVYFTLESRVAPPAKGELKAFYIHFTIIDEKQASLDFIRARLKAVRNRLEHEPNARVCFNVSYNRTAEKGQKGFDRKSAYFFEITKVIFNELGARPEYVTWEELKSESFSKSLFWDVNEFDFYYSDSFVSHFFLGKGSVAWGSREEGLKTFEEIDCSLHHRFKVGNFDVDPVMRKRIQGMIYDYHSIPSFRAENQAYARRPSFGSHHKLTSPSFEAFALKVGRELL